MADIQKSRKGGPWRFLCNHLLNHQGSHGILQQGTRKDLGNGKDTLFWQDIWLNNRPLQSAFPRLFRLSSNQKAKVANMGRWENEEWKWKLSWSRPLRIRDKLEWEALAAVLQQVKVLKDKKDSLRWNFSKSGSYSVKSFYTELFNQAEPCLKKVIPKIWANLAPPRIEIFIWLAILERINTKNKLALLNIIPMADRRCTFCQEWPEDTSHLFLHCSFAMKIWSWWWGIWNIAWVWPSSVE